MMEGGERTGEQWRRREWKYGDLVTHYLPPSPLLPIRPKFSIRESYLIAAV